MLTYTLGAPRALGYRILIGVAIAALAAIARFALDRFVEGVPFITFFPAVVAAGVFGRGIGAISCLLASAAFAAAFWLPLANAPAASSISVAIFVMMSLVIAGLTELLHSLIHRLRSAEQAAVITASEMRHRLTNLLAVVQSIGRSTLPEDGQTSQFMDRLHAIGRAQEFAFGGAKGPDVENFDLKSFLQHALAPFGNQVHLDGLPAEISSRAAHMLGLVVYELATNAMKYGALSVPGGKVLLSWEDHKDITRIVWREHGCRNVEPPARQGFGLRLVEGAFPRSDRLPCLSFTAEGVVCTMDVPREYR